MVAGVSAFHLWRRQHLVASRTAFSLAMWLALVLAPTQIVIGDLHGRNTLEHQPTKLAAMEGLWDTTKRRADDGDRLAGHDRRSAISMRSTSRISRASI